MLPFLNNRNPNPNLILILSIITIILPLYQCASSHPNLDYCDLIPFNKLVNCNVTCATCRSVYQCATCPSYMTLLQGKCQVPISEQMYVSQYFSGTNLKKDRSLLDFQTQLGILSGDDIIRFCIADRYKFDTLGLFRNGAYVSFTEVYSAQASQIALNFRLFYSTNIAILKIEINSKLVYNQTFSAGFDLNYTLVNQTDDTNTKWQLGIVTTDPSTYIDQLFAPVRTGMLPLSSTEAIIKITVQNGIIDQPADRFWGISDLNIVTRKCKTCISANIQKFAQILGIIIGVSLGVVVILLLVLFIFSRVKYQAYRSNLKKRFRDKSRNSTVNSEKLSSSSSRQLSQS